MADTLSGDEQLSLRILGFLYLRLGFFDRAARLFRALLALCPEDAAVARSLAAAQLEAGNPESALELLEKPPLAGLSGEALLLLLKARALWRLERSAEARAAMDDYLAALSAAAVAESGATAGGAS
jgi:predicted Zn-dependent protease